VLAGRQLHKLSACDRLNFPLSFSRAFHLHGIMACHAKEKQGVVLLVAKRSARGSECRGLQGEA